MITENQSEVSPEQFLSSGLSAIPGISADRFNEETDKSTQNTESNDSQADRGTTDVESQKSAVETEKSESTDIKPEDNASVSKADKPKSKNRAEERIQELVNKIKDLEAKVAQPTEPKAPPQAKEAPVFVKKPDAPQYSREQLVPLMRKARAEGNMEMLEAAEIELEKVDKYEKELLRWEYQNGRAAENYQNGYSHYEKAAFEKWPDLKDPNSSLSQAHSKVENFLKETQTNPEKFIYHKAYMASIFDQALKTDALSKENQELKAKVESYEKKMQPNKQSSTTQVGSGDRPVDEDKEFSKRLIPALKPVLQRNNYSR